MIAIGARSVVAGTSSRALEPPSSSHSPKPGLVSFAVSGGSRVSAGVKAMAAEGSRSRIATVDDSDLSSNGHAVNLGIRFLGSVWFLRKYVGKARTFGAIVVMMWTSLEYSQSGYFYLNL